MNKLKKAILALLALGLSTSVYAQTATNKIDTTGNVGIGTLNSLDGARLTLKGPYSASWKMLAFDGVVDDWFMGSFSGGGFFIGKDNFVSTSSKFVIKGDNVGIGTTSPSYKLDVNGQIRATLNGSNAQIKLQRTGSSAGYSWIGANVNDAFIVHDASYTQLFKVTQAGDAQVNGNLLINNPSANGYIADLTNTNGNALLRLLAGNIPRVSLQINGGQHYSMSTQGTGFFVFDETAGQIAIRVQNRDVTIENGDLIANNDAIVTGSLGIGDTSPNTRLTIASNSTAVLDAYGSGYDGSLYERLQLYVNSTGGVVFEAPRPGNIQANEANIKFGWRGGGASPLFIEGDSRNVGIGTTNPDSKLTVKGDIHAEEVKVDLSVPGPDYVFEEDYDLTSLKALEAYIKANKHLPEIPSAKEMEEKGIDLGVMNMLLLKKIEELTLHTIEQEKRIQTQEETLKEEKKTNKEMITELAKRMEKLENKKGE